MKRVSYIFPTSHHYRKPFHDKLRDILKQHDVEYQVVYSDPSAENIEKNDTVDIPWGIKVPLLKLPKGLALQFAFKEAIRSNLVIVQQENRLLFNYLVLFASQIRMKKVAYFGHGKNFQARSSKSLSERWKQFCATKADWWFGYTEDTKRHVVGLGYPENRITVFNNSIDTSSAIRDASAISVGDVQRARDELGLAGNNIAIYVGGLYPDKRLEFLVRSAEVTRVSVPDFELLIVGGGSQLDFARELSRQHAWIHVVGPKFGAEKYRLMKLANVFLMPGLVGLAVLDAAVVGLPVITTAFPWHSPEIAYLETGVNGLIVTDWTNHVAYGEAVGALLQDTDRLTRLSNEAQKIAQKYSIEAMAQNFASGVLAALESKK